MRQQHQGMRLPAGVASDHFLMFTYKIVPCPRKSAHDWIDCPYAHSGESARRREPHLYKPVPCPESKGGQPCPRGESCKYAHNDFEYWLHPSRFKTELCKQGPGCNRKVCFFAHQPEEVRKLSRSFVSDHNSQGYKKHQRRNVVRSPIDVSCEQPSPIPQLMTQAPPEWGKLQKLAEAQLEEALQQLRLSQSPVKNIQQMTAEMVPGRVRSASNLYMSQGIASPNKFSNFPMHLESMHSNATQYGGPPVHLHGETGVSSFQHNSWKPQKPSALMIPNDKLTSYPSNRSSLDEARLGQRTSPIAPCTPDGNPALSMGHMSLQALGRSSVEIGSPDPMRSLHGMSLSGALTSPLGRGQHYPNPCDNVAIQMNLSLQESFSGRAHGNMSPLLPGLGQHKSEMQLGSTPSWHLRSSQMAGEGPVFV